MHFNLIWNLTEISLLEQVQAIVTRLSLAVSQNANLCQLTHWPLEDLNEILDK